MTAEGARTPEERQKARDDLLAYAFRALSGRALTEAELRTRLLRRTEDRALAEEVLARVQELGYQNDEGVARAENSRRGVGGFRVRQTLKRRGVEEGLIAETLAARDPGEEQADALALLERRWPSLARKRDPRASAYAFLARRGFAGSAIWAAIHEMSGRAEDLPDTGEAPGEDFPDPE
ncbi:RecX family transcriptional regulator [Deinococcus carri]|uniref:RecX family transcriptional regulator n=1 Tax=Deinococcus carri TaxID=1211323 RepID=UPI0031EC7914